MKTPTLASRSAAHRRLLFRSFIIGITALPTWAATDSLLDNFTNPPNAARPGVYWYFMDGNLNGPEMTADLESMKAAGLGNLVFLEVNVGVPSGHVKFFSEPWQDLFAKAVHDAERLEIDISLGTGPGWCGSGGPWVKPEQSMQHLVFSTVDVKGPVAYEAALPLPAQRKTPWHAMGNPFYQDVAVFAFPSRKPIIADIDEKALFSRDPYTSKGGVKAQLPTSVNDMEPVRNELIEPKEIVELTAQLKADGTLSWQVPAGDWTIVRMGRRTTGASTRPAPAPGVGLECDKFDAQALNDHLDHYVGSLLKKIGPRAPAHGLTTLHIDSWEMGAQNWTPAFLTEFKNRRGYDARPWLPVYTGRAIQSLEQSERFLWDVRLTAQELVLENHAGAVKAWGKNKGLQLSIEPYDMNPTGDLDLGAVADVPMAEFWSEGYGFNSAFSCIESTSIAHIMGRPIVSAEAFTASGEQWRQYPTSMKNQGDWALAMGINRFVYHTFAHQTLGAENKPGMTMGPYSVHWDRGQTWWPMVQDYHAYITRCSALLREGVTVSDVLYLTPEGAPQVFAAPSSALDGAGMLPDKKGYGFDGCSPSILMARAAVKDGQITFPGGTSYRLLVLPKIDTMTPQFLRKLRDLVAAGATIVGAPPSKSPSLSAYPKCDAEITALAQEIWGSSDIPAVITKRAFGKGAIYWGGQLTPDNKTHQRDLFPKSHWIWYPGENARAKAPAGTRYFKHIVQLDNIKSLTSATATLSADNVFTFWVNGNKVGSGDNFNVPIINSITSLLRPGKNVLAVSVANVGPSPSAAGLIGSVQLTYSDGAQSVIQTDSSWLAGSQAQPGWEKLEESPPDWKAAEILAEYSGSPWNLIDKTKVPLHPSYTLTSDVLKAMGIEEDFTATGPVRYGHRRTDDRDIYFVSNRSNASVQANCRFRVGQVQPELWNPITGERRLLTQFNTEANVTTLPLEFAAHESFFVIFPTQPGKTTPTAVPDSKNFLTLNPAQTLTGAWTVAFDPKWGGPGEISFSELQDWTKREEAGIKYYSGIAAYRKTFAYKPLPKTRSFLDLGVVNDMARVRLNGKDLGVIWCAPWRVEITGAIKDGDNRLELEVVNRWPNRLIGDKQAADADVREVQWKEGFLGGKAQKTGRYTFTTHNPYNKDSKLLPSGLLGPVQVMEGKFE